VLTKRPKRLASLLANTAFAGKVGEHVSRMTQVSPLAMPARAAMPPWPLPNVRIGTSIENDDYTWRADFLRRIPAATRFLSLEPLLGPLPSLDLDGIHWVIAGGESGPEHRTLDLAWARDIRGRCACKDVAFFFKQVGGPTPKADGRQLDGRTWDQVPALAGSTR
jgi:protein gp37